MAQRHFETIPEQHGTKKFTGVTLPTGTQVPGRAGKPTGMGKFKRGDLVVVDGEKKGRYEGYSTDYFHHEISVGGRRHTVAGEETHRIQPNTDPADVEREGRWQEYLSSQWKDRRS